MAQPASDGGGEQRTLLTIDRHIGASVAVNVVVGMHAIREQMVRRISLRATISSLSCTIEVPSW